MENQPTPEPSGNSAGAIGALVIAIPVSLALWGIIMLGLAQLIK